MARQLLLFSACLIALSDTSNAQTVKRKPINPPDELAAAQDPAASSSIVLKRRNESTDDDLRKQLQFVPETGSDTIVFFRVSSAARF